MSYTYTFPNFEPSLDGKDGKSRPIHEGPPTLIFPNMDATTTGKDGEDYSIAGTVKTIFPVNKIYVRTLSGVKEALCKIRLSSGIKQAYSWSVCMLGKKDKSTLEFPNMDATTTGKDGGNITQAQAETQSTYTNNSWDFIDIWYMGPKYPLLR